jgi:hypothetical protein
MGWNTKCGMDYGVYNYDSETDVYSITLDGDEHDNCHRGSKWYNKKQRAEIQQKVKQDVPYSVEFEFKYDGNGGSSIMQLHPGRPNSVAISMYTECNNIDIRSGFNEVRLNIPGMTELRALSSGGYKGEWHKIQFDFMASMKEPYFKVYYDDVLKFDSQANFQKGYRGLICYYQGHDPHVSLGLYRGNHQRYEHVEYRNIKLTRLKQP